MSTYIRSAAMSLLSKTLLTFLYKYLDDVNVEGVELPSLYSTEGQSGWGVRLSNVKLRDGAELMQLPGTILQNENFTADRNSSDEGETDSGDVQIDEVRDRRDGDNTSKAESAEALSKSDYKDEKAPLSQATANSQHSTTPNNTAEDLTAETSSLEQLEETTQTEHDLDSETIPSRPETPTKLSSSVSYLNCFGSGKKPYNKRSSFGEDADSEYVDSTDQDEVDSNGYINEPRENSTGFENLNEKFSTHSDARSDVEDGEVRDNAMVLRLGKGGHIGTLDIRLVGKEIHVLVEDAFLVIEAVPRGSGKDTNTEANGAEGDEKRTAPAKAAEKELKTSGDRVLAKNGLARILSAIPHLFLRDIQIRFILRSEVCESESDAETTDINDADAVLDFGIEMLSVASGDDVLKHFQTDDTTDQVTDNDEGSIHVHASEVIQAASTRHEYLFRRIRTGKGEDGGIWLNIRTPKRIFSPPSTVAKHVWARQRWLEATNHCVLRCSGLDIKARVYLGTKEEEKTPERYDWVDTEYDAFYDSQTLFGFDHIAPGPSRNHLPPIFNEEKLDEKDPDTRKSVVHTTDPNGIHRLKVESCFYRVGQDMKPYRCTEEHLPCQNCVRCWKKGSETSEEHEYDGYMPMPGLTLSVNFRDSIEVNVDRASLDSIGQVISLFKGKSTPGDESSVDKGESTSEVAQNGQPKMDTSDEIKSNTATDTSSNANAGNAFPTYMAPESIQLLGMYVSSISLRVHVMREGAGDLGLSFCYWEMVNRCITLDQQKLDSEEKYFQDLRLDIANMSLTESKGTVQKLLFSTGIPESEEDFDLLSLCTSKSDLTAATRKNWPSTACALLEVQPPLESMVYESRERHGIQTRFLRVRDQKGAVHEGKDLLNLQLGPTMMDLPWAVKKQIPTVISETKKCLTLGKKKQPEGPGSVAPKVRSILDYRVHIDGGRFKLTPMLDLNLPLTRLAGERSPESGFFIESLLQNVEMAYGRRSKRVSSLGDGQISLEMLAGLPESVRLRILLFLDDLQPLEQALGLQSNANSFVRCSSVNRAIVKLSQKDRKGGGNDESTTTNRNRRQMIMNRLLKLDDSSLEKLLATHEKKEAKRAQKIFSGKKK